ncbi:hypothetical protein SAMD00019534_025980, partial [Acytostelium subglobosum LB1]|uniref:hypothetical protein n=1 Tax=Acytostelium subglobosum LB1 TaxID=1410327 RepID=UPI000644C713
MIINQTIDQFQDLDLLAVLSVSSNNNDFLLFGQNPHGYQLFTYDVKMNSVQLKQQTSALKSPTYNVYSPVSYDFERNTVHFQMNPMWTNGLGIMSIDFDNHLNTFVTLQNSSVILTNCFYDQDSHVFYSSYIDINASMNVAPYDTRGQEKLRPFNLTLDFILLDKYYGYQSIYIYRSKLFVIVGSMSPGFPLWMGAIDLDSMEMSTIFLEQSMIVGNNDLVGWRPDSIDLEHGRISLYAVVYPDNTKSYLYMVDLFTLSYTKTSMLLNLSNGMDWTIM